MTYDFRIACGLPATPQAVYAGWLDSEAQSQ